MRSIILSTTLSLLLLSGCGTDNQSSPKKENSNPVKVESLTSKVNKIPIATFESFSINSGINYNGQLSAVDADGDEISYEIVEKPSNGKIVLKDDGCFTYIPNSGYKGRDTFSYRASDETSSCVVKKVTVDVCEKPVSKPNKPSNLQLEVQSSTKIKISWNDNSDNEDGFEIFLDGKLKKVKNKNSTMTTICGLKAGTSYEVKLRAKNIAGVSESISASIITPDVTTLPDAPSELKVKSKDETSVRLSWKDNANNESSYEIYKDGVFIKSVSSRCNCTLICKLESCKDYRFEVRAKNKIGESVGDVVDVKTDGCVIPEPDTTPPVITLNGDPVVTLIEDNSYTDAGATAIDDEDGAVTVTTTGDVDTSTVGTYTITYTATDSSGNSSSSTREVKVVEANTLEIKSPLPHANCEGYILKQGKDTNGNALLDDDEITSTENVYLEGTPLTKEELEQMIADNADVTTVNTCEITNMFELFRDNITFNQDISGWNVGSVTNMGFMFYNAKAFNQPIGGWDVSNATVMQHMFDFAESFNQPLNNWDVSNVYLMNGMFHYAKSFNQPLDSWDVSAVTNMTHMFSYAKSFNQPLNNWDVSNVIRMYRVFFRAFDFDQPIGDWDVSSVTDMSQMFKYVTLSNANYNDILVKWANNLSLQENVTFDAGNSKHDTSLQIINAKNYLINHFHWTITDGM